MERNDTGNDGLASENAGTGNTGSTGSESGANEFSGSATQRDTSFDFSGSAGSTEQAQNLKDRARSAIGSAGGRLADVGSSVRERAGTAKDRLADALESGAERLRNRGSGDGTLAGATSAGSTAVANDGRVAQISDRVAGGMERSAEWLRDADIDGLKTGIEEQVKEHPGRTLLIAVGLGYLLGRAFRGNQ
jgi:hypothetical protein